MKCIYTQFSLKHIAAGDFRFKKFGLVTPRNLLDEGYSHLYSLRTGAIPSPGAVTTAWGRDIYPHSKSDTVPNSPSLTGMGRNYYLPPPPFPLYLSLYCVVIMPVKISPPFPLYLSLYCVVIMPVKISTCTYVRSSTIYDI
jgi:hypothetical protein